MQIAPRIDWAACQLHFGKLYAAQAGSRGLQSLKHIYVLSDRDVLDRWVAPPTGNTSAAK